MVIKTGPGSPLDYPELRLSGTYGESGASSVSSEQGQSLLNPRRAPPVEILVSHARDRGEPCLRWCAKCEVWKPDRCHHCSTCKTCFLRMDHHCPWFSCCIGFRNHKFFIQFLLYAFLFCVEVFSVSFYLLYDFFANEQYASNKYLSLNLVFLAVISISFLISLGCFAGFLIYILLKNTTTIEFQDLRWNYLGDKSAEYIYDSHGNKKNVSNFYDLGLKRNWQAVMGKSWIYWILPIRATQDSLSGFNNGLNFEVDEEVFDMYCQNQQLQDQLNQQLQRYRDQLRGQRSAEAVN